MMRQKHKKHHFPIYRSRYDKSVLVIVFVMSSEGDVEYAPIEDWHDHRLLAFNSFQMLYQYERFTVQKSKRKRNTDVRKNVV